MNLYFNLYIYCLIFLIFGFIIGYTVCHILNKSKNNLNLAKLLFDFKSSIDEFKVQNEVNFKDIKISLKNADNLAKTLTTNQNLKGQFGEESLELILKTCYPNENINYKKQFCDLNEDNKQIKPDYIVFLPNDKSILIDCKVNLEKFISFKENENTEFEIQHKNELIKDINTTINNLSNKKYNTAKSINQPDFIFMYIPLEPLISLIYTDSDFMSVVKNANLKNIIILGNSGILTAIRLIKELWAYEKQSYNIENIIETAQDIYNLVAKHSNNMYAFKNLINEFNDNFNKEFEKITTDNKIFKSAQKLKELGIKQNYIKSGKKLEEISINKEFLS